MKAHNVGSIALALTAASVFGLTTSLPAAAATFYNVLDLGTLTGNPNDWTVATGINDLGQVVGNSTNDFRGEIQTFRTAPNRPIEPATDKVVDVEERFNSASDINNLGQVVGYITNSTLYYPIIGFITELDGSIRRLGAVTVSAVNDSSQIAANNIDLSRAARIDGGQQIDLGTLGSFPSTAFGINDLGQVVGSSSTANRNEGHAFRTAPNSPINAATDDLGTLGGVGSTAFGINDLGQVVGDSSTANGKSHAFRTAANTAINAATDDLGTLGGDFSRALDINNSGLVVGGASIADGSSHAFLYDGNEMFDLNTLISENSGFVLTSAVGINEGGQIAVNGFFSDPSVSRTFLLTPVPESTTIFGVLVFGAGASILRKKSKPNAN